MRAAIKPFFAAKSRKKVDFISCAKRASFWS
jgi:hypothetical protein